MHTDFYDDLEDDQENDQIEEDDGWNDCAFPGQCLMPGEHFRSQCHTAEMLEDSYDRCDCCGQIKSYKND